MIRPENCCGCSACANICPKSCITMINDRLGFLYPSFDSSGCIKCGLCEKVCPAIQKKITTQIPKAWGGYCKEREIRKYSSSGGIFSLLASEILASGGVVFGAALTDDFRSVRHVCINSEEELFRLRGSKYVQSELNTTYSQVRDFLEKGKKVLFSGTPCQIEGLNLFLRKEYENLLTVEIICHGVPSPKLYRKYIDFMEKKLGSKIKRVFFRDENGGGYSDNEN